MRALLRRIVFLCIISMVVMPNAMSATEMEAQGSAAIKDGATGMAREQAIKDAMRQAATQAKSSIESTTLTSANMLLVESISVNAAASVEDVKVLEEWIDDGVFYVRIRATIPTKGTRTPSPAAHYRKKIAVLQFDIQHRADVVDLPGIEQEWPRELLRRLENSGNFLGIDGSNYLVSKTSPGFKFDDPEGYAYLAEKLDAQVLISGVIRSMKLKDGFFFDQREVDIELFIHDGISGARISNHRFQEEIELLSWTSNATTIFNNESKMVSRFQKKISEVIDRHVEVVKTNLEKIPFSARIVGINGSEVIFNAGGASLVEVGDVLMTYRLSADALRYSNQSFFLGRRETPVATISVEQVQPLFAVGKLEIGKADLFPGDIIRFGR